MKSNNLKADAILAVIFVFLSIWMILVAIPGEISRSATWSTVDSHVNSRTFPYFAAIIMGGAALVQLGKAAAQYLAQRRSHQEPVKGRIIWAKELRMIGVFLLCVLYGFLFIKIGYILATIIVPPLILLALGDRKWHHYLSVYAVGAIMYVVFQFLLRIRLP